MPKTFLVTAFIFVSLVLFTGFFSSVEQVGAQKEIDIKNKQTLVITCADRVEPTFHTIKLKQGESKTVGCAPKPIHFKPFPECKPHVDVCLHWNDIIDRARAFACDHDNPFSHVEQKRMDVDNHWKVICR